MWGIFVSKDLISYNTVFQGKLRLLSSMYKDVPRFHRIVQKVRIDLIVPNIFSISEEADCKLRKSVLLRHE